MPWPYHLVKLSKEQKHERRILLDRYGFYAQLSVLIPIVAYQSYALSRWAFLRYVRPRGVYAAVSDSSNRNAHTRTSSQLATQKWRSVLWWLDDEVAPGWGLRQHWIAGAAWCLWMLFLCIHKTGDDYLHVTKRFGIIAAAQLPLHYMLAMKWRYSPLVFLFNTSHERLNPWHRLSGRLITVFLCLHGAWYMNYYIQTESLHKLQSREVVIGLLAVALWAILTSASLGIVRRWSYRVFYSLHIAIGVAILPVLFFHVSHLRLYVIEALCIFLIDRICRKIDTFRGNVTITRIPQTNLLKLQIAVPESKISRFQAAPGQHIYLSIPVNNTQRTKSLSSLHRFISNPFSVADVSGRNVTLVVRARAGPMTRALDALAESPKAHVSIEGPLGGSRRFPNLGVDFDRVLLVAGGVGGTFAVPIYLDLREQLESEAKGLERLGLVWAARSAAEANWAVELEGADELGRDENVQFYVTRGSSRTRRLNERYGSEDEGALEMDELEVSPGDGIGTGEPGRPDLGQVVDNVFGHGDQERVAVLFCGPSGMARQLRRHVGQWVQRGRDVWWYEERFGW
ncbi:hypothetical protein FE257_009741 [Aspergillus nanangensis]|uniref:FAD-binding FR-type domain-containing protein n=1 Tax=Aspergillus nanangensis TaxID=2582783 RepID=A0AAD4CK17_ASPNN|nr:hypothetical protein FE257_009741 [Aspergillus nanangensis]